MYINTKLKRELLATFFQSFSYFVYQGGNSDMVRT